MLMLIVACANVTNLLLGLSTARRHEMLVRGALGASPLQLAVPMLRESSLLGVVAGVLGYALAYGTLVRLSAFKPSLGTFFPSPSVDLRPDLVVMASTWAS
jgi:ABC-type lipoprotein release transport system permease subunit